MHFWHTFVIWQHKANFVAKIFNKKCHCLTINFMFSRNPDIWGGTVICSLFLTCTNLFSVIWIIFESPNGLGGAFILCDEELDMQLWVRYVHWFKLRIWLLQVTAGLRLHSVATTSHTLNIWIKTANHMKFNSWKVSSANYKHTF